MYLSRRYVVALVAALIGLVAYVAVPKIADSIHAQQARDNLAAATTAVARLQVPADFVRVSSISNDAPCPGLRCYRVAKPTLAVATLLPAMLGSVGAPSPRNGICTSVIAPSHTATETCRTKHGICTANPEQFPPTASCQPTEGACDIHRLPGRAPYEMCQLFAKIHNNSVGIILEPYIACHPSGPPCRATNDAQVIFYGP